RPGLASRPRSAWGPGRGFTPGEEAFNDEARACAPARAPVGRSARPGLALADRPVDRLRRRGGVGGGPPPPFVGAPGGRAARAAAGADARAGWTDLVIKSIPHLVSGDLGSLPAFARETAALFRTVIVADVRRQAGASGRYDLKRLGLGLCVPFKGVDTVVST